MKDNTVLIYAVTLIGITLLCFILWNLDYSEQPKNPIVENPLICGTVSFFPSPDTALEKKGDVLFKMNCAACHKIFKSLTGPALLQAIKKYPSDTTFISYINRDKVIHETDVYCIRFPQFTYEDAVALRAYINLYKD